MEPDVNYRLVGIFVIALFTVAILGIIWLSSGLSFKTYTTYAVYMQESVSGLSQDSAVEYNGVEVGKVKTIKLNPKNPQWVEVLLHIKDTTPITEGTIATLTTRGLTGLVFIALKDKGLDPRPLVAKRNQPYPVIKTTPSIFVRLESVLTDFTVNFRKISDSLQSLLDKGNLASIKASLRNLEEISHALAANTKKFEMILRNTANASARLEMDAIPAATQMFNRFDEVADTLSDISLEIKQNPAILLRGVENNHLGPGETK